MKSFFKILIKVVIIIQFIKQKISINKTLEQANETTDNTNNTNAACNNFYQFACSNYSQENPNATYNEITQQLDYQMNQKLLEYFQRQQQRNVQTEHNIGDQQTYYDKVILYWESCIKTTKRNITKYLDEIKPSEKLNWPLWEAKEKWLNLEDKFDYWPLLGQMQAYGFNNIIVKTYIVRNQNNTLNIWLAPAESMELTFLKDKKITRVFLEALEVQQDIDSILEELEASDLFWQELNKNLNVVDIKEVSFNELASLFPKLSLQLFLEQILESQDLENISKISIENMEYFKTLNEKSWTLKELLNLSNYLMLKFLYYLAVESSREFTQLECLKDLRNKFDLALNYIYYEQLFKPEQTLYKKPIIEMFYKLQNNMIKHIQENHLQLTAKQVEYIVEKLESVKVNIGNLPDNYCNNNKIISQYYQTLPNLSAHNYYKNHLFLLKHRFSKSLLYTQNQSHFIATENQHTTISSPFYIAQQNMIIIPFDSLQLPLYHYNQTALQQYSLLGFVLAHELTHVIDTSGLIYDLKGLPVDHSMDLFSNINFSQALACMQTQEFTEELDERIADLFGVRVAYRTYLEHYSPEHSEWSKEFFMHLAQFFCGKNDLVFIGHDTDTVRLQQTLKNFEAFAQAYGCREDSAMNPKDKCRLY